MKFSCVGSGFIFQKHIEAIASAGGEICDIANENSIYGWREMISKTSADCVVILAPNHLHYEIIKEAIKYKKIVLCEKPLTLSSKEAESLIGVPDIYTVMQLRYHPVLREIEIKEKNLVEIEIFACRDENYYKTWKGQEDKSGGILFNLGIHYFDLLLYLFGEPESFSSKVEKRRAQGAMRGDKYFCSWRIDTEVEKDKQRRIFKINGKNYEFATKDNLHKQVYQDLIQGRGILPEEATRSIRLVEKLNEQNLEART